VGDRSNVFFRNGTKGVGVYGHWAGLGMADAAAAVLANKAFKARLGDANYATRVGVQTVLGVLGVKATDETGCGLWTSETGPDDNEYPYIVIDVDTGELFVTSNWKKPKPSEKIAKPTKAAIAKAMKSSG
jgi:hypothetical protein